MLQLHCHCNVSEYCRDAIICSIMLIEGIDKSLSICIKQCTVNNDGIHDYQWAMSISMQPSSLTIVDHSWPSIMIIDNNGWHWLWPSSLTIIVVKDHHYWPSSSLIPQTQHRRDRLGNNCTMAESLSKTIGRPYKLEITQSLETAEITQ